MFIGDAATNNVQLINTAAASAVVLTLSSTTGTVHSSPTTTTAGQLYKGTTTAGLAAWSTTVLDDGANTVKLTNGTSVLDIAASTTANIDTNLTVQTGAVTLTGNAAGSTLVLPSGSTTLPATTTTNGVIYGASSTAYGITALGTEGQLLRAGTAGLPGWSSYTLPAAPTTNGIVYGSSSTAYGSTAAASVEGSVLRAGASPFVPAWTAYALPATVTTNALLYASSATAVASSTITTDGTNINAAALNLISTGTISGRAKVLTVTTGLTFTSTPATVTTDRVVFGGILFATTTATVVLPEIASPYGRSICIQSVSTNVITVTPNANDGIRNGSATRNANGHTVLNGAAAAGEYICLVEDDTGDGWSVFGKSGTWTDQ